MLCPLIFFGDNQMEFFRSREDAEAYMEPIDVRDGVWQPGYDSEGRLLRVSTRTTRRPAVARLLMAVAASLLLHLPAVAAAAPCEPFEVYYTPLSVQFYVPPTREDIIQGSAHVTYCSQALPELLRFVATDAATGLAGRDPDTLLDLLRIIAIRVSDGAEVMITADRWVVFEGRGHRPDVELFLHVILEIKAEFNARGIRWPPGVD